MIVRRFMGVLLLVLSAVPQVRFAHGAEVPTTITVGSKGFTE